MLPKLLSYASLQAVLQFMDPNLRYQLSQRFPQIRTAENSAPLRISRLYYDMSLQLNNVNYQLGIIQKHDSNEEPANVRESNESGGVDYDVDQYGCLDQLTEREQTIRDATLSKLRRREENVMVTLEQLLNENPERGAWRPYLSGSICAAFETTQYFENCRTSGVIPPYKFYIQLTITSPSGVQIERVEYNKKLWQAEKELISKVLARGSSSLKVNSFYIKPKCIPLRWPLGLQVDIRILKTCHIEEIGSVQEILCESSFPLKQFCLQWNCNEFLPDSSKQLIDRSETFVLNNVAPEFVLNQVQNRKFVVKYSRIGSDSYNECVRNWFDSKKEAGYCWTFESNVKIIFSELLDKLMTVGIEAIRMSETAVHIPTGNNTIIKVFYTNEEMVQLRRPNWKLTMEIGAMESTLGDE